MKEEKIEEKVAQLWCLPQHGHKEMDVHFAESIIELVKEAVREALESPEVMSLYRFIKDRHPVHTPGECKWCDAIDPFDKKLSELKGGRG